MEYTNLAELIKYLHQEDCDGRFPFMLFGVECGKGWWKLLDPVFEYVRKWNEENGDKPNGKIHITQVKEKWGTLRIYANHYTEELEKIIAQAEQASFNICETCGSTEDVGMIQSDYQQTICHECLMKKIKSYYSEPIWWHCNSDGKDYDIYKDGREEPFPDDEDDEIPTGCPNS